MRDIIPALLLFQSASLGDGLELHLRRTKAFKTVACRVVFHAPLDDASAARALVPRLLGRGTARLPSLRALQIELDRLFGASLAGDARKMGDRQLVQIRSDWVMDRLAGMPLLNEMAALISEFVREPVGLGQPDVFLHERKGMGDEADSIVDDKAGYARHRLISEMCRGESYARPAIGNAEEIRALELDQVRDEHTRLLTRTHVDIFLVGDVTMRDARRFAKALNLGPTRRPARLRRTQRRRPTRARTVREREDIAQARLAMGFRTRIRPDSVQLPALLLMNSLFGGSSVGKLFKVVREQESLCYSIGSQLERTKGLLLVHAGIDAAHYPKARRLILKQLAELQNGQISDESFAQAHGMLLSGFRSLRDSPAALIDFALERTANGLPVDLDGLLRTIETVTVRDVKRAARTVELDTVYLLGN